MDGSDERFDAKVTLLKEDVEHHVEEEETELFPQVKKALGDGRLEDLGRQLASRKQSLTGGEEEEREEVGAGARSARGVRRTTVPRSTSRNRSRAGSRGRPRSRSGRAGGRSGGRSRSRR